MLSIYPEKVSVIEIFNYSLPWDILELTYLTVMF